MMMAARPSPNFVADSVALDFLNATWPGPERTVKGVSSGEQFLAWLEESGIVPAKATKEVRKNATLSELDAVTSQALALAKWFREFVDEYRGRPLPASAADKLRPLNLLLERDYKFGQIDALVRDVNALVKTPLTLRSDRHWRSHESLLQPLGYAMAELICEEDFSYVRECEGRGCRTLFLDKTRSRARRWCSMAVCGNRVKQANRRNTP